MAANQYNSWFKVLESAKGYLEQGLLLLETISLRFRRALFLSNGKNPPNLTF